MPEPQYPGPPSQTGLADLLGMVGGVQNLQRFQAEKEAGRQTLQSLTREMREKVGNVSDLAVTPTIQAITGAQTNIANAASIEAAKRDEAYQRGLNFISTAQSKKEAHDRYLIWAKQHPDAFYNPTKQILLDQVNGLPENGSGLKTGLASMATQIMGAGAVEPTIQYTNPITMQPGLISRAAMTMMGAGGGGGVVTPSEQNKKSQEEAIKSYDIVSDYQNRITPFMQAYRGISKLEKAGKEMGPGSELRNNWINATASLSKNLADKLGMDTESAATYAETAKWLHNVALGVPGGQRNADALNIAVHGSPNPNMPNVTIKDMLKTQIALANFYQTARQQALAKNESGLFLKHFERETNTMDPTAFAFDLVGKEQKQKIYDAVKKQGPDAVEKFKRSLHIARQNAQFNGLQNAPLPED